MDQAASVVIAYLHVDTVSHSFMDSLMAAVSVDGGKLLAGRMPVRCPSGDLAASRNKAAAMFLDGTEAEWLWFVDSDIGFAPDTPRSLVDAADPERAPVVGALCFGLQEEGSDGLGGWRVRPFPTVYAREPDGRFRPVGDYPQDRLVRVDGTGAGCLLVHRRVLEGLRRLEGDEWFDRMRLDAGGLLSEDLSFCARLAACRIPLHVHTGIRTSHHKAIWIT